MTEIKNTLKIQIASVKNFLSELGYTYMDIDRGFMCTDDSAMQRGRTWISTATAIKLHNGSRALSDWHGGYRYPFDNIPKEWIYAAHKAAIVRKAKLQVTKYKKVIAQSHIIELIDKDNYELLIK